jgi:hypothetical protein
MNTTYFVLFFDNQIIAQISTNGKISPDNDIFHRDNWFQNLILSNVHDIFLTFSFMTYFFNLQ